MRQTIPFLALVLAFLPSCARVVQSTKGDAFSASHRDYTYCAFDAVKQHNQIACGAASLAAVAIYWNHPASESSILSQSPPDRENGYTLGALAKAAETRGMKSFVIANADDALSVETLRNQIRKGRPLILPWACPFGRYFDDLPLVESFDSRTLNFEPFQSILKKHFIVVIGYKDDGSTWLVMDPAYGIIEIRHAPFLQFWRGASRAMLLVSP